MALSVNMQNPIAAQAEDFKLKPENLLLAIVYNSPEQVSDNLQSMMGVSFAQTDEQIMDWFEEYGGELDVQTLYNILDVPFDPDVTNVTADYWQVLQYEAAEQYGDTQNDPIRNWAEVFPDAIETLYNKYFAGQQSTGQLATDIDKNIIQKSVKTGEAARKIERSRKRRKTWSIVFNLLVAVTFLFLLIYGIITLVRRSKGGASGAVQ